MEFLTKEICVNKPQGISFLIIGHSFEAAEYCQAIKALQWAKISKQLVLKVIAIFRGDLTRVYNVDSTY